MNVYSKGATWLGRMLSNFARTPFECVDGRFESVEGYWYWLSVSPENPRRDELRSLYGWRAKSVGRELRGSDWTASPDFQRRVRDAIAAKLASRIDLLIALAENQLPLRHYYVYGGKVVEDGRSDWILKFIEEARDAAREALSGS